MSGNKVFTRDPGARSIRITTATTTVIKAGTGVLWKLVLGNPSAGTITINDATGTKLRLAASFPARSLRLSLLCTGKIEIVTTAACELLAVYA